MKPIPYDKEAEARREEARLAVHRSRYPAVGPTREPVSTGAISTGHKAFDRQTNYIAVGNVWAPTQTSAYLRAHSETVCNGFEFAPGELQAADFKYFPDIPRHVRADVEKHARDKRCILYKFHHAAGTKGRPRQIVHGYVLTDDRHDLIATYGSGWTPKGWAILDAVTPHVAIVPARKAA